MYFYSAEKNVLQLISLLKLNNIKKIVASPGTTNIAFIASIQNDDFFEIYSCVDERSAAYMACGLAEESEEIVALSCTGATASRNYYPALTEAFYRKLPILAITSSRSIGQIGHNIDQVTDRTKLANDVAVRSVYIPIPENEDMEWENNVKLNMALIDLKRHGGGPVHINLMTNYLNDFSVRTLPNERLINYYSYGDILPSINVKKIGIFVGAHKKWKDNLLKSVEKFCELTGAVVLYEPGSNYKGNYGVPYTLINWQAHGFDIEPFDIMLHIGDVAVFSFKETKEVWRINRDGELRDTFKKLTKIFELEEEFFFEYYNSLLSKSSVKFVNMYNLWNDKYNYLIDCSKNIDIPFSNLWIAMQSKECIPSNSELHLGILNSVRSWTILKTDSSIDIFCNTGGYGIDGGISSLIGASLYDNKKLYFGIFGDLSFFYDMNSLGNRHIENNVRIMIVNNGMGGEFKNRMNLAQKAGIGEDANLFISAAGHFGNKSKTLIKDYVQNLGFKYISADNKESFNAAKEIFFSENITKPIVFEVFTTDKEDSESIRIMMSLDLSIKDKAKVTVKNVLGDKTINSIKKVIKG